MLPNNPIEDPELFGVSGETPEEEEGAVEEIESTVAGQGSVDAGDMDERFRQMQNKYEADISNLKSSLQKDKSRSEQEWKQRYESLESAYHQLNMSGMNDAQKASYERDFYANKYQTLQKESNDLKGQIGEHENFGDAVSAFSQLGVGLDRLNLKNGLKGVVESGWAAVGEDLVTLRKEMKDAKTKTSTTTKEAPASDTKGKPAPGPKSPPKTSGKAGGTSVGKTWGDTITSAERLLGRTNLTEEDIWRAVENGELDPKILPGLG